MWKLSLVVCFVCVTCRLGTAAKAQYSFEERVVTDLEVIMSPIGVPLDFRYNESKTENDVVSAPGCPKSIDGYPWIYYQFAPSSLRNSIGDCRCYLAGTRGPCPVGQVLLLKSGCMCGVCACDCLLNLNLEKESDQRYRVCNSISGPERQIYDSLNKSVCYKLNEQGPCPDGMLLALEKTDYFATSSDSLTCLPRCDVTDLEWYKNQVEGKCTLETQAQFSVAGFLNHLHPRDCPAKEKFSKTLKQCVKRHPRKDIIIG